MAAASPLLFAKISLKKRDVSTKTIWSLMVFTEVVRQWSSFETLFYPTAFSTYSAPSYRITELLHIYHCLSHQIQYRFMVSLLILVSILYCATTPIQYQCACIFSCCRSSIASLSRSQRLLISRFFPPHQICHHIRFRPLMLSPYFASGETTNISPSLHTLVIVYKWRMISFSAATSSSVLSFRY